MHVVAQQQPGRGGWSISRVLLIFTAAVALFAAAVAADHISPWPVAFLTQIALTREGRAAYHRLEKHLPANVYEQRDQHYDASDPDGYLDVYSPAPSGNTAQSNPTVIWIHGGAWITGNKNDIANYARILASRGATVVAVDYSLAPAALYPLPLLQINAALAYLIQNAGRLHVDANRIFLAGDSAGAQLAAQMANIISSPIYAEAMAIRPSIQRNQLKGVVLFGGVYDIDALQLSGISGFFMRNALRSYTGNRDFHAVPRFAEASVAHYITPDFPPAFVSVGNGDPFLAQSLSLINELERKGVLTDTLLFPADHVPALRHEYQFNLDNSDGKESLARMVRFLNNH